MSTTIYNGFKVKTTSLKELHNLSLSLKSKFIEKCEHIANSLYVHNLIREHYKRSIDFSSIKPSQSIHSVAYNSIKDRQRKVLKTGERDPLIDFDINWVFIPLEDKDYTLALFYSDQRDLEKIWKNEELIEYYGYWNNVDPDEDCTEEEWNQREEDWAILDKDAPSTMGFSFCVFTQYNMPPVSYRRRHLTPEFYRTYFNYNKMYNYLCFQRASTKVREINKEKYTSDKLVREWIKDNPNNYKEIKEFVRKHLKKEYTLEDFLPSP